MSKKIICILLLIGGNSLAFQVSKEGRADLNQIVSHSREIFPNRYKGTIVDIKSLRAACLSLEESRVLEKKSSATKTSDVNIRILDNKGLVAVLHKMNRQPMLLAILRDRRFRVNQALPDDFTITSSVYAFMGIANLIGNDVQIHEPKNLRANFVGFFDDLITTVQTQTYSECVNIIDEVVSPGVQI